MTDTTHILVVDDDPDTRDELNEYLTRHGYRVGTADGGAAMRRALEREPVDLVILDLTLPEEHGLALVGSIRDASSAGVIILTGTGDPVDRIVGLELGVDDYMSKPCDLRELLARVRSVLRRTKGANDAGSAGDEPASEFAGWILDPRARRLVAPDGVEVSLTTAEFDLLVAFVDNPSRVLNRDQLLDMTHNRDWSPFDRSIDNLVSRLRHKIEADTNNPKLIKTVRGVGYVFVPKVTRT